MSFKNEKEFLTQVTIEMFARSPSRSTPMCVSPISQKYYKIYRIEPKGRIPKVCLTDPLFKDKNSNYRKSISLKKI